MGHRQYYEEHPLSPVKPKDQYIRKPQPKMQPMLHKSLDSEDFICLELKNSIYAIKVGTIQHRGEDYFCNGPFYIVDFSEDGDAILSQCVQDSYAYKKGVKWFGNIPRSAVTHMPGHRVLNQKYRPNGLKPLNQLVEEYTGKKCT